MIINVPLEMIAKNPWQTRQGVDPEHVKELAADIAANGLLQTPLGRLAYQTGAGLSLAEMSAHPLSDQSIAALAGHGLVVQLAFGHNRFEAYQLNFAERKAGWARMPVEIRVLNDEQMADYAWAENERRQDLTPIERALAIQNRMEHFGWNQEQIADRLRLGRSTVANILRLLKLPEELQASVQEGKISERQAQALLPMADLPESLRQEAEAAEYYERIKPSQIIKAAEKGESSDDLRDRVGSLIDYKTKDLKDALWPTDHTFSVDGIQSPTCDGCSQRIQRGRGWRCLVQDCFKLKAQAWKLERLQAASQATGIPYLDKELRWQEYEAFYTYKEIMPAIRQEGCPNLRLMFEQNASVYYSLEKEGFPEIRAVCLHGEGQSCACLARHKKEVEKKAKEDPQEKKREANRKKLDEEILAPASQALAEALAEESPQAWKVLMKRLVSGNFGDDWSVERIRLKIARELVKAKLPYSPEERLDNSKKMINEFLQEAGLPVLGKGGDQVDELLNDFERIHGWIDELKSAPPELAALSGNLANLSKLASRMAKLSGENGAADRLAPLSGEDGIEAAISRLEEVRTVLMAPGWVPVGFEEHAAWLLTTPPGDINFKSHLQEASAPILAYVLALVNGKEGHGTRAGIIRSRLNALEKEGFSIEKFPTL